MSIPVAWAQATTADAQSFWTREGPVTDVPLQQRVVALMSDVTSKGSQYMWDPLRVLHLKRVKDRRFEAVLELPQTGRDASGRHLLISVHAPIREYEMNDAAQAIRDVLACSSTAVVDGDVPDDLAQRLRELVLRETSVRTWMRRKLVGR